MWSRVVELMLGCWLLISPFIFRHPADELRYWAIDLAAGSLVIVLALLSYWQPARHAHLGTFVLACLLAGYAMLFMGRPLPAAAQNHVMVGGLLLMFALVPNQASQPPRERMGTLLDEETLLES